MLSAIILSFVIGIAYTLAGIWCLHRLDQASHGRAMAWISGILLLELLTLALWPLAVVVYCLDRIFQALLRISVRGRA